MEAKKIAQTSARTQAQNFIRAWEHLAFCVAKTEEARKRALDMAEQWVLVSMVLTFRIMKRGFGTHCPEHEAVADALVESFKVDHG